MIHSGQQLKQQYSFKDFIFFITLAAVPVLTAFLAISQHSVKWSIVYLFFAVGMLALVLKYYCSHCPHYNREGRFIKCLFIWGLPKIFTPRPGTLSRSDMAIAFSAFGLLVVSPLYWLIQVPMLLIIYCLSFGALMAAVRRSECERCIYFGCPANKVPSALK